MDLWTLGQLIAVVVALVILFNRVILRAVPLYADKDEALASWHDLNAGGTFAKGIVKGPFHQAYLKLIAWRSGANRIYTQATVVPAAPEAGENEIVKIRLGKLVIGRLSGEDARRFHTARRRNVWPRGRLTCPAVIIGRHTKNYSVWLDLPF